MTKEKQALLMVEALEPELCLDEFQLLIDTGFAFVNHTWLTRQACDLIDRQMCVPPDRCPVPPAKLKQQVMRLQSELKQTMDAEERAGIAKAIVVLCALANGAVPAITVDRTIAYRRAAKALRGQINGFLADTRGVTAIEYGVLAAGIAVAIVAAVNALGGQLQNTFTNISTQLGTAGF